MLGGGSLGSAPLGGKPGWLQAVIAAAGRTYQVLAGGFKRAQSVFSSLGGYQRSQMAVTAKSGAYRRSQTPYSGKQAPITSQLQVSVGTFADTDYGTVYQPGPNGGREFAYVGGWGDYYYSFWKFNLNGLPLVATSAVLYLYCTTGAPNNPNPRLYRITQDWNEATLTRSNAPTYDNTTYLSPSPAWSKVNGVWNTIPITALYNAWQAGTYVNYGVTLRPTSVNNTSGNIKTKEYQADPSKRPYLLVTYEVTSQSPIFKRKVDQTDRAGGYQRKTGYTDRPGGFTKKL